MSSACPAPGSPADRAWLGPGRPFVHAVASAPRIFERMSSSDGGYLPGYTRAILTS
jgi:hypothetical protein